MSDEISKYMAKIGSKGGTARIEKKTKKELSEEMSKVGQKGGKAVWQNRSKEERSREMSRRRKLGLQRQDKK